MTAARPALSPAVAGQLLALLCAAGEANRRAAYALAHACAACGHDDTAHDLDKRDHRTRCSVTAGPTGTRCPCPAWAPITTEGTDLR